MSHITPFLWFNDKAEEAATRYGDAGPGRKGSVMTISFELDGQPFTALNGGPQFPFTEAVSFVVNCEDQQEVDDYWEKLTSDGGTPVRCGWLKDRYGLSRQIVPRGLSRLLQHTEPQQSQRVMQALLQMQKIDISSLEPAAAMT
jgi:predicted 3-demethylubiquinone-9 3-methyltransferase (glyoxalase superfamily)